MLFLPMIQSVRDIGRERHERLADAYREHEQERIRFDQWLYSALAVHNDRLAKIEAYHWEELDELGATGEDIDAND